MRSEWNPETVTDPRSGQPFTQFGAWEFIAECLEADSPFEEMDLTDYPGKRGYVMKVTIPDEKRLLYTKLLLLRDQVAGISFHLSIYEAKP